jgi:hypothetical protein
MTRLVALLRQFGAGMWWRVTDGDRLLQTLVIVGLLIVALSGVWAIQAPPTGWITGSAYPIQEADYSQEQGHIVFAPSDAVAIAKAVDADRAYFAGTPAAGVTPPAPAPSVTPLGTATPAPTPTITRSEPSAPALLYP